MVRLTRIYTRGGDAGDTSLGDGARTRKDSARVHAYGEVDELNSVLGVARSEGLSEAADERLGIVQNDLFDLGADLCVPGTGDDDGLRVRSDQVQTLEAWCDEINETLSDLPSFILPGGGRTGAALHLARSVCRRAERAIVALLDQEEINPQTLAYVNRLSDFLFILSRAESVEGEEVLWRPGGAGGD